MICLKAAFKIPTPSITSTTTSQLSTTAASTTNQISITFQIKFELKTKGGTFHPKAITMAHASLTSGATGSRLANVSWKMNETNGKVHISAFTLFVLLRPLTE